MYVTILSLICVFVRVSSGIKEKDYIVHTKNGDLKGARLKDLNGKEFIAFRSIPYAKPPIKNLRFKAPEPAKNWDDIRDATKEMPVCPQSVDLEYIGEEDCLYLNVYTEKLQAENITNPLRSVMVFVHGGHFWTGSATMKDAGPEYLITKGIVLVTFHYRIGALGFLSLNHDSTEISPNNALKDQILALKWVQKNIKPFGGDPGHVTLFGQSSGAACVHFLMLSPLANGLFHKAILESGTATVHWSNGANNSAIHLAETLNIATNNETEMILALQATTVKNLIKAQCKVFFNQQGIGLVYGPPIIEGPGDDNVLTDHPKNIIKSGKFRKIPFLIGYNNMEGIMFDQYYMYASFIYKPRLTIPYYLNQEKIEEIKEMQAKFYWHDMMPTQSREMINVWTDLFFKYDAVEDAKAHAANGSTVYLYEFSMDTMLNVYKRQNPITAIYQGASHVDELCYILKCQKAMEISPLSVEGESIRKMTTLWTNFAKYGTPTPGKDELLQNQIWQPITGTVNYMKLGTSLEAKLYKNAGYDFWKKLYRNYSDLGKSIKYFKFDNDLDV